ncbi:polysaccharide biosynthesis protein [Mangrovactinospora gilvigrisea]|uniref:polysaccharide biosynthesis protein n=1 Tax=Mangrovactinospora gilvigrisea TaxID=1428644 RepID=UPI000B2178B0|nr:polysaccharide biosynthesis protein [Mangrovactinospora gilvigrisea]
MRRAGSAVGAGTALLAGGCYVHLALAGRALAPGGLARLSTVWALVFSVGIGLFFPVEQELTRALTARRAGGRGVRPVVRRGIRTAACLALAAVCLAPLALPLLDGRLRMAAVLAGALAGLAVAHTVRGVLAGLGLFPWYAAQLAGDGLLRVALPAALWTAGCRDAAAFGAVLVAAPVLSCVPAALRAAGALRGDAADRAVAAGPAVVADPAGADELRRGFLPLLVSSLLSQALANAPVIGIRLLAPGAAALTAALMGALVLVRAPQFLVTSVQAGLLAALTDRWARGDTRGLLRRLGAAVAAVGAVGLVAAGAVAAAGPWALRVLFAATAAPGRVDLLLLGLGSAAYLTAFVLANGLLAMAGQRAQGAAWAVGAAVLLAGWALPAGLPPVTVVGASYLAGAWSVAVVLAVAAVRTARRRAALITEERDEHERTGHLVDG